MRCRSIAVLFLVASLARAQSGFPSVKLNSIVPSTVRMGEAAEVQVIGESLDGPTTLLFSNSAIVSEPLPPDVKTPKQGLRFKVMVPEALTAGAYDVRLAGKWGVSNPLAFHVAEFLETLEKEPNNDVHLAQPVKLDSAIRGIIATGNDVDYFVFAGKKGQRVLVGCLAGSVGSALAPLLQLYDEAGKQLASDQLHRQRDALLDVTLPADGKYWVRLSHVSYSSAFGQQPYLLRITTGAWIDTIDPCVLKASATTRVTVYGRNLPGGQLVSKDGLEAVALDVPAPDHGARSQLGNLGPAAILPSDLEWFDFRPPKEFGFANSVRLGLTRDPIIRAVSNIGATAEAVYGVQPPCEIVGQFDASVKRRWFSFDAKKGETLEIDALGDRLGSPLDLYLAIHDRPIERVAGLKPKPIVGGPSALPVLLDDAVNASTLDPPRYKFVAPETGRYFALLGTRTLDGHNASNNLFRLLLRRESPDFRLFVSNQVGIGLLRKGGHDALPVQVARFGGWQGDVALTAEGLPPGVTCPTQYVGPNSSQGELVFRIADDAPTWTGEIRIRGEAAINGQPVKRLAASASAVPKGYVTGERGGGVVVAVRDSAPYRLTAGLEKATVVQGEKLTLPMTLTKLWPELNGSIKVTGLGLPNNLTLKEGPPVPLQGDDAKTNVVLDVKKELAPGNYNVVFQGQTQAVFARGQTGLKNNVQIGVPSSPLTLTVLPGQLATITVVSPNPTIKRGADVVLSVKLKRLYGYEGEFKIAGVVPNAAAGLMIAEATIPAHQDDAKLTLHVGPNTPLGNYPGITLRLVAQWQSGHPVVHEIKLNVNVVN